MLKYLSGEIFFNDKVRKIKKDYPEYRITYAEANVIKTTGLLNIITLTKTCFYGVIGGTLLNLTICKSFKARVFTFSAISIIIGLKTYFDVNKNFRRVFTATEYFYYDDVRRNPRLGVADFSFLVEYSRKDDPVSQKMDKQFRAIGSVQAKDVMEKVNDNSTSKMKGVHDPDNRPLNLARLYIIDDRELDQKYEDYLAWRENGGILAEK